MNGLLQGGSSCPGRMSPASSAPHRLSRKEVSEHPGDGTMSITFNEVNGPQPLTSLKVMLIVPSPGCSLTSFRLSRCGAELAGDILPGHELPPCKSPFMPATWYRYPCPSVTHVSGLYSRVCRYGV